MGLVFALAAVSRIFVVSQGWRGRFVVGEKLWWHGGSKLIAKLRLFSIKTYYFRLIGGGGVGEDC